MDPDFLTGEDEFMDVQEAATPAPPAPCSFMDSGRLS